MFDSVNEKVGDITTQVGLTPQAWNGGIFNMVRSLSDTVILPIAGIILTIVMTLELIQLLVDRNNLHDVDIWMFFKWTFKTACAVLIVSNTWNIVMAVFDVANSVVNNASGVIVGSTSINFAVRPGIPGVSHYDLRGDLRRTRSKHWHWRRCEQGHLDLHGVHGAAVLHPVQDREPRKSNFLRPLMCWATLL